VLGLNALRLYDVDPLTVPCRFTREELALIRHDLPSGKRDVRPDDRGGARRRSFAAHRGMP
jgi:hypothetical protein